MTDDWHAEFEDSSQSGWLYSSGYGDYLDYEAKINQLQEQDTHFVRWGAADPKYPGISVGSNNFQGGYVVTEHLIAQGRTRFVFVGEADSHAPEFLARFQGFTHAHTSQFDGSILWPI